MAATTDPSILSSFDLTGFLASEQRRDVPNHLIDTKIFAKLGQNELLQVRPASIAFNGFQVGKVHSKTLKIINTSADRQRMHIVPPTSQNFKIKYVKEDTLVPGLHLEVTVLFRGAEYIYYNDCIRIHSKASENLVVPLYAYPVMNFDAFPSNLHFPPTPIGHRRKKSIPLQSTVQVDFEFKVSLMQRHAAFTIEPMAGFIRGGSKVDIEISFTPQEYCTAQMQFQLLVSQFNAKPLLCSVTGTSIPGLAKDQFEKQEEDSPIVPYGAVDIMDPRALSPLNRSRNRKAERKKTGTIPQNTPSTEIVQDGIRFPSNLNNPSAVSYVLSQKTGKIKVKDLREAVKLQDKSPASTKQMKEAVFEHLVSRTVAEEERNQLRWCIRLGDDPLSSLERDKIIRDREVAVAEYHIQRGDPQMAEELNRSVTLANVFRTHRQAMEYATDAPCFDFYANDIWSKRHLTLIKFVQAARKVMIRERVTKNIQGLGTYIRDWRKGKFSVEHSRNWEELDEEQKIIDSMSVAIDPAKIKFFSFPDYQNPRIKDDMAVDALGPVTVSSTDLDIQTKVRFFDLKVPSQYKVLGYTPQSAPTSIYVPTGLARPLREGPDETKADATLLKEIGGEKEKMNYTVDDVIIEQDEAKTPRTAVGLVDVARVAELETSGDLTVEEFDLVAPSVLFRKREYPPLHIFNPEPGMLLHAPQLPHSEADEEHKVLPVPIGTDNRSTIKLHKEDVIQGAMTWKRFPLQGLISLSNTPSLSAVFVPRWSDPFSEDMMPAATPELLKQLPEDDAPTEEEFNESEANIITPTMEMVHAQFEIPSESTTEENSDSFALSGKLPPTNNPIGKSGPLSRKTKQKELDKLIRVKKNRLGQRIRINTENLKSYLQLDSKEKSL